MSRYHGDVETSMAGHNRIDLIPRVLHNNNIYKHIKSMC